MTAGAPRGRDALRATIRLGVRDHAGHESTLTRLMKEARRSGLAGATVFQAQEGFGDSRRLHRTHLLSDDAPVALVVVDEPHAVTDFLARVEPLLASALVTLEETLIVDL